MPSKKKSKTPNTASHSVIIGVLENTNIKEAIESRLLISPYVVPNSDELPAIIKKANEGDPESQHLYACYFEKDKNDYVNAKLYYEKAASQNYPYARYALAEMYTVGKECQPDPKKALEYLNHPLLKNYTHALILSARIYMDDIIIPQNLPLALNYFQAAAKANPPSYLALLQLGKMCEFGTFGIKKDISKAVTYYKEAIAIATADLNPQIHLAKLYFRDPKTHKQAYLLFQDGAKRNCFNSLTYAAVCRIYGYGTKKDIKTGLKILKELANRKIPAAQYFYAVCLMKGIPGELPKNPSLSYTLVEEAAAKCHLDSMFLHARMRDSTHPENSLLLGLNSNLSISLDASIVKEFQEKDKKNKTEIASTTATATESATDNEARELRKIVRIYKSTALHGMVSAMFELGMCYLLGRGITKDEQLAIEWLQSAANNDHSDAMLFLGGCYLKGSHVAHNPELAFKWYELAANKGNADAAYMLAETFFDKGIFVNKDETQYLKWITRSSELGNRDATFALANFHFEQGNYECAFKEYKEAARAGHLHASTHIARCHLLGHGTKKDLAKGFNDLSALADLSNFAKLNVAYCYLEGLGATKNIDKAKSLFNSIEARNEEQELHKSYLILMCDIHIDLEKKHFTEQFKSNLKQLETLANGNNSVAIQQLGEIYKKGLGVERNPKLAFTWFQFGANKNFSGSLFELANLYEHGIGIPMDSNEAITLYQKASNLHLKPALIRWHGNIVRSSVQHNSIHKNYISLQEFASKGFEEAQILIALCYLRKLGVKCPPNKGFNLLKKLSEMFVSENRCSDIKNLSKINHVDDKMAQFEYIQLAYLELGLCYKHGLGTEKDENAAKLWLKRAVEIDIPETIHLRNAQKLLHEMEAVQKNAEAALKAEVVLKAEAALKTEALLKAEAALKVEAVLKTVAEQTSPVVKIKETKMSVSKKDVEIMSKQLSNLQEKFDLKYKEKMLKQNSPKQETQKLNDETPKPIQNHSPKQSQLQNKVQQTTQNSSQLTYVPIFDQNMTLTYKNSQLYRGQEIYVFNPIHMYDTYVLTIEQPFKAYGYYSYQYVGIYYPAVLSFFIAPVMPVISNLPKMSAPAASTASAVQRPPIRFINVPTIPTIPNSISAQNNSVSRTINITHFPSSK